MWLTPVADPQGQQREQTHFLHAQSFFQKCALIKFYWLFKIELFTEISIYHEIWEVNSNSIYNFQWQYMFSHKNNNTFSLPNKVSAENKVRINLTLSLCYSVINNCHLILVIVIYNHLFIKLVTHWALLKEIWFVTKCHS